MYPSDVQYTKDHEWIRIVGSTAEIGITDFAQQQLGDVVFVELPLDVCVDDLAECTIDIRHDIVHISVHIER